MCKPKRLVNATLLTGFSVFAAGVVWGQVTCITCPPEAQATAVGAGLTVTRANGTVIQPGQSVGACEKLNVLASVAYAPQVFIFVPPSSFQLVVGSGFFGGTGSISVNNPNPGSPFNVTPANMATTTVGPLSCADTSVKGMNNLVYTLTAADIAAGSVRFSFNYGGGHSLLGDCSLLVSASAQFVAQIVGLPSCSLAPAIQEVCAGDQVTLVASSTGPAAGAPFTFTWTGPGGFTATGSIITINNAQEANEGTYVATITDQFGCTSTCTAQLIVNPSPTCVIQPASQEICVGASATFTVNVSSGTAPFTINWTGPGGFTGTGPTITINNVQEANEGTFTANVTDANGCTTSCSAQLNVVPCCTGRIGDFVWHDLDANGCQDAGEPGIPGVQVDLYSGCAPNTLTLIRSTTTDASGKYLFNELCAGTYTVSFHTPAGYARTLANQACNVGGQPADATDSDCACAAGGSCGVCVTLTANNSEDLTIDCGYVCAGEIGDFVWHDANANGCQDAGEPGIPGVQVDLYSGCAPNTVTLIRSTTTDANGKYLFSGLCAGTYTVSFHTPAGYARTLANQNCNVGGQPSDATDSDCACATGGSCGVCVTLTVSAIQNLSIDCGYVCVGEIGDFVWHDVNANGCQDDGEPGIPGVQVDLYSGCAPGTVTLTRSTTTDANGKYLFSGLCVGTYTVSFHTPAGYARTSANQNCNVGGQPADATDSDCDCATGGSCGVCVTLTGSNSQNLTIDCGYVCAGEIGDFVWQDNDGNGCQDAGEPGIPGVQVDLYSGCAPGTVTLIRSTTTDADGKYLFGGLCAGTYTVSFHTPAGYSRTPANQSCNVGGQPSDETDSDCDCTVGDACGICVTLPTATGSNQNLSIDCGYIPNCPLTVTKECFIPPAAPEPFNCSDAKPIDTLMVRWIGSTSPIWVKAWNGSVGSGTPALFGPVATGDTVTFTRSGTFPNDIYFEIFTDAARTFKLGTSTFHLSCSDSDMNGPEDCGKTAGDGKARTGFINDWIFEGLAGSGLVLACTPPTPTPDTACSVLQAPMASCETIGKPTSLVFRYNGGGCANPDNNNPQSGKFTCKGSVGGAAQIYVRSLNKYPISPQVVNVGESFTVTGGFDSQSTFVLSNNVAGGSSETNSIHTSCSQPLAVGDVFGDLTLVGFSGQTGGSSVTYRYSVHNGGGLTLNNVFLTDDKLGAIAGPFSLLAGETKVFDVTAVINATVVNTATAFVQGQNCAASSAPVTVNVVPKPEPFDCSAAKPINTMKVKWNGSTSPIWVKAWNGNVGSGTPALFGPVATGDTVTFTRSGTFPNDIYFEIFTSSSMTAASKLGTSTFHLSCSDADMNGSEDCGKAAGDGKGKTGFINDWIFEGLAGNGKVLGCSP